MYLFPASQRTFDEPDAELNIRRKAEEPGDGYHVNARHLLYPNARIMRFPVPNEKVPWEVSITLLGEPMQEGLGSGGGEEVPPHPVFIVASTHYSLSGHLSIGQRRKRSKACRD